MYAPNLTPGGAEDPTFNTGAPSDFSVKIGGPGPRPLMLTPTSIMEFDHFFSTEASFDGGVVEISVGDASFNSNNPLPNNVTHFDLGYYMIREVTTAGSTARSRRAFSSRPCRGGAPSPARGA
jgi:hypothetical protein